MVGRYNNILFDLDGTLTDSAEGVTRSIRYALLKFGIESHTDDLKSFIGPPLQQSFQIHYGFSEAKAIQALNHYRDYFREKGIFQNKLYPYVTETLEELAANGINLFLATSKPTVFAETVLQNFQIKNFFSLIAGSNLDGTRVEKSEIIAFVLKQLGNHDKAETVMVGDREHDIIGARECGLDSIAVTYGYGSLSELTSARPTYMADSIPELRALLLFR